MIRKLLVLVAFLITQAAAGAAELHPLGRGDVARLLSERQGRPVALTLWSVDCPHCKGTLRQLAALAKANPRFELLVVNTDNLDERRTIAAMLAASGLGERTTWVFGDEAPERLRYEIDRRWGGEMPRTYLYDADRKVAAFSGPVSEDAIADWLARNGIETGRRGR